MKKALILLLSLYFSIQFSPRAQAQVIDSLPPWFDEPAKIMSPELMNWDSKFTIVSNIPKNPTKSKIQDLGRSLVLNQGKKCYEVTGASNKKCRSCKLYWLDKDADKKVVPKSELRAICSEQNKVCGLKTKKVKCR